MTDIRKLHSSVVDAPAPHRITTHQVESFRRDGLLHLPGLFTAAEVTPLAELVAGDDTLRRHSVDVLDSSGEGARLFGWSGASQDLLGLYVRIARMVDTARDLLDRAEIYHWHSKLSMKPPGSRGRWDWHQDYGSWYREGCLSPDMVTISVAVDPCDEDNGCMRLVRGSHRLGRIEHRPLGPSQGADPEVVERVLATHELVECVLAPGDAVVFHSNTLHSSGPNPSSRPRTLLHVSYNKVSNPPFKGMPNHAFRPLECVADDALADAQALPAIDLAAVQAHRAGFRVIDGETVNPYGYQVRGRAAERT